MARRSARLRSGPRRLIPALIALSAACGAASPFVGSWRDVTPGEAAAMDGQTLDLRRNGTFTLTKPDRTARSGRWERLDEDKLKLTFSDFNVFPRQAFFQLQDDLLVQLRAVRGGRVVLRRR